MTTTLNAPDILGNAPRPYHWTVDAYHRAWDAGVFGHDAQLELVFGRVIERFAEGGPTDYHWTADAFDHACDAGVFEEPSRVELIHGRVIDRMGQGPLHLSGRVRIGRRLWAALNPKLLLVEECPVHIAFDGVPVAGVALLRGDEGDYDQHNPTSDDVTLLIEIAVTSADYGLSGKALLYSQAGIADYWVAMPGEKTIVVHREPTAEGYQQVTRLGENDNVSPLAVSETSLSVRSLLGL